MDASSGQTIKRFSIIAWEMISYHNIFVGMRIARSVNDSSKVEKVLCREKRFLMIKMYVLKCGERNGSLGTKSSA